MKKVITIVPKKLEDSKPPIDLSCGFAMAQVAHANAKAGHYFNHSQIILEVPDQRSLRNAITDLVCSGVKYTAYWEYSHLFEGRQITAVVVEPLETTPDVLKDLKLWSCECTSIPK